MTHTGIISNTRPGRSLICLLVTSLNVLANSREMYNCVLWMWFHSNSPFFSFSESFFLFSSEVYWDRFYIHWTFTKIHRIWCAFQLVSAAVYNHLSTTTITIQNISITLKNIPSWLLVVNPLLLSQSLKLLLWCESHISLFSSCYVNKEWHLLHLILFTCNASTQFNHIMISISLISKSPHT